MELKELSFLFSDAASGGVLEAPPGNADLPDTYTIAQAARLYGKELVGLWCRESLIHPVRMGGSGSKKMIDRLKIQAVARSFGHNK